MPIPTLLTAERIILLTGPSDRDGVLSAAARLLSDASPSQTAALGDALRDREALGSTAIGHGVAVPHARSNAYDEARGAFLRLDHPVDFGNGETLLVDLVFALNVPEHSAQLHLQTLSEIASRFSDPDFRDALRGASDLPALRKVLLELPHTTMAMSDA